MDKVRRQAISLIYQITKEIKEKNIEVIPLCERLCLSPEEFLDLMNKPQNNLSLYIEILEEVRNERD